MAVAVDGREGPVMKMPALPLTTMVFLLLLHAVGVVLAEVAMRGERIVIERVMPVPLEVEDSIATGPTV